MGVLRDIIEDGSYPMAIPEGGVQIHQLFANTVVVQFRLLGPDQWPEGVTGSVDEAGAAFEMSFPCSEQTLDFPTRAAAAAITAACGMDENEIKALLKSAKIPVPISKADEPGWTSLIHTVLQACENIPFIGMVSTYTTAKGYIRQQVLEAQPWPEEQLPEVKVVGGTEDDLPI